MTDPGEHPKRRSSLRRWVERAGIGLLVLVVAIVAAVLTAAAIDLATRLF